MPDDIVTIASGREDGTLQVVFGDRQRTVTFQTGTEPVDTLVLADVDGRRLVITGGSDGGLREWDLDAPAEDAPGSQSDKVEWLTDAPADEDLLRRRPLARALATRPALALPIDASLEFGMSLSACHAERTVSRYAASQSDSIRRNSAAGALCACEGLS